MPFHDLHVLYKQDHTALAQILSFHHELGYQVIALTLPIIGKLPPTLPSITTSDLSSKIPAGFKLLTRMTLTVADTAQNHRINALQSSYDILALRPTTEKTFQLCCSNLECDLISLDFSQRLPFILRFTTVASALQRGIRFEICYSPGVINGNTDARRHLISGATSLIRATRGRGIIISSEAKNALGIRAPADVINLAQVWGLGQERGKEALCEEAGRVVKLAGLKRSSYRGVVDVIDGGSHKSNESMTDARQIGHKSSSSAVHVGWKRQEHTQQQPQQSNGQKRKASITNEPTVDEAADKPVSTRKMRRKLNKAKFEGNEANKSTIMADNNASLEFGIQHESSSSIARPAQDTAQIVPKKK